MKKAIIEEYRISGRRVAHMKLEILDIPENETLSMLKRYRFDPESTQEMLLDSQRYSEAYRIEQEQKEYEEMNYDAICRRMSQLSTIELIRRLVNTIVHFDE